MHSDNCANFILFNSNSLSTELRYISLSTNTRLNIQPDFQIKSMIGKTFSSILDAYEEAINQCKPSSFAIKQDIMDNLIKYRYYQDEYFRDILKSILHSSDTNVLIYHSDNLKWGGDLTSDGILIGQNFVGKMMMKYYLIN